jgi:hypothetical protein
MATDRLFPTTSGPANVIPFTGPFLAGIRFGVTAGGGWFQGYYWWAPSDGDVGAQKFALWAETSVSSSVLVAGSVVTSGTLTPGTWNFVPLPTPLQLGIGATYVACTGWTAASGFPDTQFQFNSTGPYAAGITSGLLTAWSDGTAGGTNNGPNASVQGLFSAALGADPSVNPPNQGSNSSNFWMDVLVSDTAPTGYTGTWQLFPNMPDAFGFMDDLGNNYTLGTEVTFTAAVQLNAIRYYSPPDAVQVATDALLWDVGSQSPVTSTHVTSPAWSGAAGSGWVQATYASPPTISPGDYKISVANLNATPGVFNATTANYFTTGFGAADIVSGPITCPTAAHATPPGQCTYQDTTGSPALVYPDLYITGQGQNYWLDAVVTPVTTGSGAAGSFLVFFP